MVESIQATEYSTATQVATVLGVKAVTVRKYALAVEQETGNPNFFDRDSSNSRIYTSQQVDQFKQLMTLKSKPNETLKTAVRALYAPFKVNDTQTAKNELTDVQNGNQRVLKLLQQVSDREKARDETIKQLQSDNKELKEKLDHITKMLENKPAEKHGWLYHLFH